MTELPSFLVRKRRGLTAKEIIELWGTEEDAIHYARYKTAKSTRTRLRRWADTARSIWLPLGFLLAAAIAGVWGAWVYIH